MSYTMSYTKSLSHNVTSTFEQLVSCSFKKSRKTRKY